MYMTHSARNITQCVSTCFKVLYLAEAADVCEMVHVKIYIYIYVVLNICGIIVLLVALQRLAAGSL